ncbi:hypothetical protein FGIG_03043 [Fasciola gigantica]|uniref:Cytochrome c oxidase subunit 5B mitochondrial n=1 Tax=Fasciola gigantica TaxID=46835 RepID=A0A504Z508_FASGI|nr:hypothetical protein FGIG_03043 [Fasciola gigantica]
MVVIRYPIVTASGSLNVPVSKGVSKMQEEMIKQLEVVDLEFRTYKERRIQPSTRENPNLVGSALERQVSTCVCYPDTHYVRYMVLYRDLPMRCQCGHWFKLIDMDRFEQEREKHWQKIKDEPENAKLLQQLTDTENELNRLMEKGKDIKRTSPGADDLLEALANQWEKLKTTYAAIRRKMELP